MSVVSTITVFSGFVVVIRHLADIAEVRHPRTVSRRFVLNGGPETLGPLFSREQVVDLLCAVWAA